MTRVANGDFTPLNVPAEGSVSLGLEYHDQQYLAQRMTATSRELDYIPDLHPDLHQVELGRISIRNLAGEQNPSNLLSLAYTSTNETLRNATLRLQTDRQLESTIQLSPNANIWEVWHPNEVEPTELLENSDLITRLSKRLLHPEAIDPLMDKTTMTPFEIAHLLGSHLKQQAKRRKEQKIFSTTMNNNQATARLDSSVRYGKKSEKLSVSAPYKIGQSTIRKVYDYRVNFNRFGPVSGEGMVTMQSNDGIAINQLHAYALADQEDNYPIDSLHTGLRAIRQKYDLYEENQRVA